MAIDVDGLAWSHLAVGHQAPPQHGLEIQGTLHGDGLEETVLGGGRGEEEEAPRAGGGQPAFEQGRNVMLDVMPGDEMRVWLAGAVQNFDLLFGQEAGREGVGVRRFFCQAIVGEHRADEGGTDGKAQLG